MTGERPGPQRAGTGRRGRLRGASGRLRGVHVLAGAALALGFAVPTVGATVRQCSPRPRSR